jgi:hypothetical protein
MAYKVSIKVGSGKNTTRAESVALPNKERVTRYVKQSPIGNYKTNISVKDLNSGKTTSGRKIKFYNPNRW